MTDATMTTEDVSNERAAIGIPGLDDVLHGGLIRDRMYIVEGSPGTGKTTVALQFLREGARRGEPGLYITLSETAEELRAGAASHGWSLEGVTLFELIPPESLLDAEHQQSLLYSSDLELGETTKLVLAEIERRQPTRIVLDSVSEIRLLAQSSLRYRRQILAFKHYFARHKATVMLLDDLTGEGHDQHLHSVAHGVIRLEETAPAFGAERRRTRVIKYRGTPFRGGFHDYTIETGGVRVFPRLVAAEHAKAFDGAPVRSGIDELDELLGGGLNPGSSTLLVGPSGTGKSLLALCHVACALEAGRKAAVFVFDEGIGPLLGRAASIGLDLARHRDSGRLAVQAVDPAALSPGEFVHKIRAAIEEQGADTVVIDSLNGYHAAMPEEQFLILHMHELISYLNRQGVVTIMTMAQHGLIGDMRMPADLTYLSDTILMLRYFEARGQVRRAISAVKKRGGAHERTIREYHIGPDGIRIGAPLENLQGVFQGVPSFVGRQDVLTNSDET